MIERHPKWVLFFYNNMRYNRVKRGIVIWENM